MPLNVGTRILLLRIKPEMIVGSDWLNERAPQIRDEAVVESILATADGAIFRLLCEPAAGFLIWRVDIRDGGFEYETLL